MIGEFDDRIIGGRQVKLYSRAQIISSIEAMDSYSVAVFNDATLRDEITIPPPPGTGIANGTIGTMDISIGVDGTWTTRLFLSRWEIQTTTCMCVGVFWAIRSAMAGGRLSISGSGPARSVATWSYATKLGSQGM